MKKLLIIPVFMILSFLAFGQKETPPPTSKGDDLSRFEYADSKGKLKKSKKKTKGNSDINDYYDQKKVEYEERMKANAKRHKKMRKKMRKREYSDPTYFGHKRPPKKRPPGKKKFCKICELVH